MLFVTGMLRCGTTLLDKLLASHPRISLLSQPFPLLFIEAKRAFLQTIGRGGEPYPLSDLFLDTSYSNAEFERFLHAYHPSRGQLLDTFRAMTTYSGQCTRFEEAAVLAAVDGLRPGDFAETLAQLYRELGQQKSAAWFGGKETLCEEFLPYLLGRSAVGAIIVRDPRDMLASLNHGRGQDFTGTLKPTLFNLRHWRKSVAFAMQLRGHPRFAWMRYEDLVATPAASLNRLAARLGVPPFTDAMFDQGVKDQSGEPWAGNSSHFTARGLDASSIGIYRTALPPEVTAYAEATCYAELKYLGYAVSIDPGELVDVITSFRDPYQNVRENLRERFASGDRTAEELARVEALGTAAGHAYFLSGEVRELLRHAAAR